jgi:hypothetical protein
MRRTRELLSVARNGCHKARSRMPTLFPLVVVVTISETAVSKVAGLKLSTKAGPISMVYGPCMIDCTEQDIQYTCC